MADPHFKGATPEKLVRALLKPVNRKSNKTKPAGKGKGWET